MQRASLTFGQFALKFNYFRALAEFARAGFGPSVPSSPTGLPRPTARALIGVAGKEPRGSVRMLRTPARERGHWLHEGLT